MNTTPKPLSTLLAAACMLTACADAPASSPTAPPSPSATQTSLLPDGIWEVDLSADELIAAGSPPDETKVGGVYRWTFDGTRARIHLEDDDGGLIECDADASPDDGRVRLDYREGPCGGEVDLLEWSLDADGLHFDLLETNAPFEGNQAYLEAKAWQPVDGEATLNW